MDKIVLFLMNKKGLEALTKVLDTFGPQGIDFVVLSKDANVVEDYYSALVDLCERYNVRHVSRENVPTISGYAIAIGWRWLIKDCQKLIVFHDALLPRYRGFAPLVTALINGERQIGVTALLAAAEYDAGPIIAQRQTEIVYPIKISACVDRLAELTSELITEIFARIISKEPIQGKAQNASKASYSLWRDEDDYSIPWGQAADVVKRFIDSTGFPYKGAKTTIGEAAYRIHDAEVVPDVIVEVRDHGKVIFVENGFPVVVCGKGLLRILDMKSEKDGSNALPLRNFRSRFQ